MFVTGTQVDKGQFSKDIVGTIVADYSFIASELSIRRWNKIKVLCRVQGMEDQPNLNMHSGPSQVNRRALYVRSSPVAESDGE